MQEKFMTTPVTLNSIDAKLEHIVSVFVELAEEQAQSFRRSDERMTRIEQSIELANQDSIERMARIEQSIELARQQSNESFAQSNERMTRIEAITERQAEVAKAQADSVRDLVRMLNQRGA